MTVKSIETIDKAIEVLKAITDTFYRMREVVSDEQLEEEQMEEKLAQFIGKIVILQSKLESLEV